MIVIDYQDRRPIYEQIVERFQILILKGVLEQDEQMRNDREIRWKPLKLREGDLLKSVYLNWDFNEMNYNSIYAEENSKVEEAKKEDAKGVMLID